MRTRTHARTPLPPLPPQPHPPHPALPRPRPLQAELLEVESQGLLAEASKEKLRVDQSMQRKAKVEQVGTLSNDTDN